MHKKFAAIIYFIILSSGIAHAEQVVNLYTARHNDGMQQLYDRFEQETGIKVNVVSGKAPELIERIQQEGGSTPADLFFTVDGGMLYNAKIADILTPITTGKVLDNVPANLRDKDNYWIALTARARVIVYSIERIKPADLSTYEDLADPKWQGKILARPCSLYDQSLAASLIALDGEELAAQWLNGFAANFARAPQGNDRAQAKDIAAGVGDVALMNTYYICQMLNSEDPEEVKAARTIGVFFPNQQTTGTHINISGIGLVKHAPNRANAIKLVEFLTNVEAQTALAAANYEYPVNPMAQANEILISFGTFKAQAINFDVLGEYNARALEMFADGGWE